MSISLQLMASNFKKLDELISSMEVLVRPINPERWQLWDEQRKNLRPKIDGLIFTNAHAAPPNVEMQFCLLYSDVTLVHNYLTDPSPEVKMPPVVLWPIPKGGSAKPCAEQPGKEHVPTALRSAFSSKKARSKKRGRVPRLAHDFVAFAGRLWHEATQSGQARVSNDQLAQIALKLDEKGYMPPADYLEGRAAKELKTFNIRNSNSRTGAIQTWSRLISHADKDHLRGMRKLLSRCALKTRPS